jgi:hypothetical protein
MAPPRARPAALAVAAATALLLHPAAADYYTISAFTASDCAAASLLQTYSTPSGCVPDPYAGGFSLFSCVNATYGVTRAFADAACAVPTGAPPSPTTFPPAGACQGGSGGGSGGSGPQLVLYSASSGCLAGDRPPLPAGGVTAEYFNGTACDAASGALWDYVYAPGVTGGGCLDSPAGGVSVSLACNATAVAFNTWLGPGCAAGTLLGNLSFAQPVGCSPSSGAGGGRGPGSVRFACAAGGGSPSGTPTTTPSSTASATASLSPGALPSATPTVTPSPTPSRASAAAAAAALTGWLVAAAAVGAAGLLQAAVAAA